jgi:hypothetical protein
VRRPERERPIRDGEDPARPDCLALEVDDLASDPPDLLFSLRRTRFRP